MPTYTETQAIYTSALNEIANLNGSINEIINMGNSYYFEVKLELDATSIVITSSIFYGNVNDREYLPMDRIPIDILRKYLTYVEAIELWKADGLADFPDLKAL